MTLAMSKFAKNFVTTKKAAEMLGVDTSHIRNLLIGEKIEGIKQGHDWIVFVPSLEKYLANKSTRGRPTSGKPTILVEDQKNVQG